MVANEYRKILTGNVRETSGVCKSGVDNSETEKREFAIAWIKRRREIRMEALKEGKSADEIQLLLSDAQEKFLEKWHL